MKMLISCYLLFTCLNVSGQEDPSYAALLKSTEEIHMADSLLIDAGQWQLRRLDSTQVKKWFSAILGTTNNNRLKNRGYYLAGKITSYNNFDLLVMQEEKKRSDSTNVQVIYLITSKKDGKYISSLEVAVTGTRKKSNYNTSSWLYKDLKIMKDSKMTINEKLLNDLAFYKINGGGRFILNSNY